MNAPDAPDAHDGSAPRSPEPGERMLLPCEGGPSISRLVTYPPPLEIVEHDGVYVLVDDGPPATWSYTFVPAEV